MPHAETIAPFELMINRTINAPRERVFRAWTEAAELDRWFSPDPNYTVRTSVDLRIGGAYSIEMRKPDGQIVGAHGVYKEIHRPDRLIFTWTSLSCGDTLVEDSLVTVEFFEVEGKTQITLTHQQFTTADIRDRHNHGWHACIDHLQEVL
ncbi:MAG TPA: SRPBCC domain-containing protein [Acidobacteriaceae bacterium]|nr:SRPBCC domain-containing protein [Acidobacteriaceae bacterium]